ncbi:MAG: hypothetical protein ABR512_03760 [Desulfopila sp.]
MNADNDIIIHPVRTQKDRKIPPPGILCVNPGEARAAHDAVLVKGGRRQFLHNAQLAVTAAQDRFVAGPAIGAPAATLVMEKLIALGARRIILMGWCGSIDTEHGIGDITVPTGALCGEGTSQYYMASNAEHSSGLKVTKPSCSTVAILSQLMEQRRLPCKGGRIWSTDAPYRESRSYLQHLNTTENISGVDMEFSALCSVAAFRGVEFAAVLVVSDELWARTWCPGFKNPLFKQRCGEVMDSLLTGELPGS